MHITIIKSYEGILSLKDEWNNLVNNSESNNIFLTWEWLYSWMEVSGKDKKYYVVTVRNEKNRLVGVAPYYMTQYILIGILPFKILIPMAEHRSTGSEYPSWLMDKDCKTEVLNTLIESLISESKQWDCIWMPNMNNWNPEIEEILLCLKDCGLYYRKKYKSFSGFSLPNSSDEYMARLSTNMRSQIRRDLKRIASEGEIKFEKCDKEEQLSEYLEQLFELHFLRWKEEGQKGVFKRNKAQKIFYQQFIPLAFKKNWLGFYRLKINNATCAIQIGYIYNGIFHQLQEGYDPKHVKGMGNALRWMVIDACISENIKEYDFLGQHTDHKRRWGAEEKPGFDLFISNNKKFKNKLINYFEIWPSGKYLNMRVV